MVSHVYNRKAVVEQFNSLHKKYVKLNKEFIEEFLAKGQEGVSPRRRSKKQQDGKKQAHDAAKKTAIKAGDTKSEKSADEEAEKEAPNDNEAGPNATEQPTATEEPSERATASEKTEAAAS